MKFIVDILKGMVMGVANVIPGVSGGTMAVAMGIYDRLINAFTHIFKEFKKSFKTLLPIGIGMGLGIVGLSLVIDWMFSSLPVQTNLLFIGLILGGVPAIWARLKGKKILWYSLLFVGVLAVSFAVSWWFLSKAGDSMNYSKMLLDAMATTANIVAIVMMAFAYMEQWYLWTLVNVTSVILWTVTLISEPDAGYAIIPLIKYSFYFINGINGIRIWWNLSKS